MALVSKEKQLLFVQVPATGSSVLGAVLRREFGFVDIGRKHADVRELLRLGLLNGQELSKLTVVATIRNPLDRWVTEYERYAGGWWKRHAEYSGPASEWFHSRGQRYKAKKKTEAFLARVIGFRWWLSLYFYRARRRYKREGLSVDEGKRELVFPRLSHVSQIIRYELLSEDSNSILGSRLGVTEIDIPVNNVTPGKLGFLEYYDDRLLTRIEAEFGKVMREFEYVIGL